MADVLYSILILITLGIIYFLPTVVAGIRSHRQIWAIFALNLLLGWSFIGWAAAMVWALIRSGNGPAA
jgi:hypothetical protein